MAKKEKTIEEKKADWYTRFMKHQSAVKKNYNPFSAVVRFTSPYLNWLFGNTHGLPRGKKCFIYGPDKAGKTVLGYNMVGQIHKDYPNGFVLRFDTEYREDAQLTPALAAAYGIDMNRYIPIMSNVPEEIFDYIENEVAAMCEDGCDVVAIIIDSIAVVRGLRELSAESVNKRQIGDKALTIQGGLERILAVLNKYKIGLIMMNQVRDEQDMFEKMRGNKYKMWGGWFLKHFGEYKILVEPNMTADGTKTLTGAKMEDASVVSNLVTAKKKKGEQTGHRIKATMKSSSLGPKNRVAEFTFDYKRGIVNTHEEVFALGVNRNIVQRPTAQTYLLPDFPNKGLEMKWVGRDECINGLATDPEAQAEIIKRVKEQDIDLMEKGAGSIFFRVEETLDLDDEDEEHDLNEGMAVEE